MSKTQNLRTFRRADLLPAYPGPVFPLSAAREAAPGLAQRLAPLPLILLGRGVAQAFQYPEHDICQWRDYLLGPILIRAAVIPHPSGRNPFYRDRPRREYVMGWLKEQVEAHRPEKAPPS